jgi:2-polyprenyl-3-methyl-5-hydroxy-6-metoxy-1,4-benzoquinol methylase
LKVDYAAEYRRLHANKKWFTGKSIMDYAGQITELVYATQAKTILDYGCGKGKQYSEFKVHERWGGILPYCYDVGVPKFSKRPQGQFDGVICTDVMEHIDQADVEAILADIYSFVRPQGFAFFNIACRPSHGSKKKLSDGRDVHLTVKPPHWWLHKMTPYLHAYRTAIVFDEGL